MLRFADFELDRGTYQLRRAGRPVHLERIPLDLLFLLAERRGQLVARDEIAERIWGKGVFLDSDASINVAVRKIRQALGDDAAAPRFLVAVPAKGYRFVADVRGGSQAAASPPSSTDASHGTKQDPSARLAEKQGSQSEVAQTASAAAVVTGGKANLSDLARSVESEDARLTKELNAPPIASHLQHLKQQPAAGRLVWGKFIGRAEEMAALRVAIDAALGGQASLVMVIGEPGIGKTRLAEEAGAYARLHGAQVLAGRCYEGEGVFPYSPFVEVIREYISIRPADALQRELGNKVADLAKLVPEIRERIPDFPPSPAADQNGERMRLFDSVAAFLVNASKVTPIILHLEDLHWADKPTLLLLQHLARRFKGGRLFVIGTYRDVELDQSHPLSTVVGELRHERLCQRMLLRRFSESEVKELIEAISEQETAEGPGEAFVRAILHQTEGNPFFIEEVLRHLVESGELYRRDGGGVTDPKAVAEMKVPEDVRDVIVRRLTRLSESTNRVLEAAAVLGREFEFEALGRMSELGKDAMVPAVEEALRHRLVVETRDRGRPRYAFTHALVRQTLYEELSLPRKQRLHLKAAQAIEAVHERNLEPHVAALANQYRMAGAAAHAEKTIDYSIRAGRSAYAVFAYEEAGLHWRAALELMDEQGGGEQERRAKLLLALGDEFVSSGAEAIEYLEAAAPIFEELGDDQGACDVHTRITTYLVRTGAKGVRRAMSHIKKAETLLAKQPESRRHASFYMMMVNNCSETVQIGEGLAAARHAIEICERQNLEPDWCIAAAVLSLVLVRSGSVTEGLRLADQARQRAAPINNTTVSSIVAWLGAANFHQLANPRAVQEWCKSELAKPRTAHALVRRGAASAPTRYDNAPRQLHNLLVTACVYAGELTEARAYLAEADTARTPFDPSGQLLFLGGKWELEGKRLTASIEQSRAAGAREEECWGARLLARVHRFTEERAQSSQFLLRALEISVEGADILYELATRSELATMAADAGDADQALQHLQRCRQIVGAGENWYGLAGMVERAEAVVAAAQGESAAAETYFEKAIATFQRYCRPWDEAETLQYWGRALLAAGEGARAIEKFDAAIEIYRSHGAGTRFIEYVMADKLRAQNSKSTHHAT